MKEPVLADIRMQLREVGGGSCGFVSNEAAHTLARFAISLDSDQFSLEEFPDCIANIVSAEMASV